MNFGNKAVRPEPEQSRLKFTQELKHQPRRREAVEAMMQMVRGMQPEEKLPTVVEMSEKTGISVGTIHSALDELERRGLIFRLHRVGIFVTTRVHEIACVCGADVLGAAGASPFWNVIVEKARQHAEERGARFSLHLTMNNGTDDISLQAGLREHLKEGQIHGVIAIALDNATVQWIENLGIPVVVYGANGRHIVGNGHLEPDAARLLAEYGCKNIAYWRPRETSHLLTNQNKNHQTNLPLLAETRFREALAEHGLELDPNAIKPTSLSMSQMPADPRDPQWFETKQIQGYRYVIETLSSDSDAKPDGIFITDDMITQGVLVALDRLGLKPGKDVIVVTHANAEINVFENHKEDLILIEFNNDDIMTTMYDVLIRLINGEKDLSPFIMVDAHVKIGEDVQKRN